jgi:predicted phage-related endonuclease
MGIGNQKRSFEIVVAPGDESIEKKFDWDGTGTDKIVSVKSSKDEEQAAAPEGEPAAAPEGEPAAQPASESYFS